MKKYTSACFYVIIDDKENFVFLNLTNRKFTFSRVKLRLGGMNNERCTCTLFTWKSYRL